MILIVFMLCGFALWITEVNAKPPQQSIYDKFTQNDYKLKFEHIDVDHYNKSVAKEFRIVTFKYNRTCTAVNGTSELKIDLNNDMELVIQTYIFASNEYREFPLRFQVNACHALSKNLLGIGSLTKSGNFSGCPLKKICTYGLPCLRMHISNWSTDESKFPPLVPSGRYLLDIQLLHHSTEIGLVKGYGEIYRPIPIPD